jgi:hypothetical protein
MSAETESIRPYLETFAEKWRAAPDGTLAKEIQRRNLLLGVLVLSERAKQDAEDRSDEGLPAIASVKFRRHSTLWDTRARLLPASLELSAPEATMPDAIMVLESLAAEDGAVIHNLDVPIP